jgi:hypothetical protein
MTDRSNEGAYRFEPRPMPTQEAIADDLRRLATGSGKGTVSYDAYKADGAFSVHAVVKAYGKWNSALQAAGLSLTHRNWIDQDFQAGLKAVWDHLKHRPTYGEYKVWGPKLGFPGISTLEVRYGSYSKALAQIFGVPAGTPASPPSRRVRPDRRRHATGEPIHHPVMPYAPINEMGTVALLGVMAHELGIVIEGVRGAFPDVAARRLNPVNGRYEPVEIEVEYKSSSYLSHGHPIDANVPIVCWIHDWEDCPPEIEVIELQQVLRRRRRSG